MTDHEDSRSDGFEARIKRALVEREQDIGPEASERLAAARRAAVEASEARTSRSYTWPGFAGAGAVAAAVLVAVLVVSEPDDVLPFLDEAEMAAAAEQDMLEELEFLAWMVAEESLDDSGQG